MLPSQSLTRLSIADCGTVPIIYLIAVYLALSALLEQPGTVARLRATLALLQHETAMLRTLRLVPAPLSELPAPTHLN